MILIHGYDKNIPHQEEKTLLGPELHLYMFCDVFIVNTPKIISYCTDITGKQCLLTSLLID